MWEEGRTLRKEHKRGVEDKKKDKVPLGSTQDTT